MSYVGTNGGNRTLAQALPNWKTAFASQVGLHTTEFPSGHRLLGLFQFLNTRNTHGSYHAASDSHGSSGQYCPWSWGAWHAPSINRWSVGVSANCRADEWDRISATARRNLINGMALQAHRYSRWQVANGRPAVPARRLTRAQALRREAGFVYHGALQADRTDPYGPRDIFPWSEFLAEYRRLEGGGSTSTPNTSTPTSTGGAMSWSTRLKSHITGNNISAGAMLRDAQRKAHQARQASREARDILKGDAWISRFWNRKNNTSETSMAVHVRRGDWRYRNLDYVNDEPSTKDAQLARAHQYSRDARSAARENKAMIKALASTLDELLDGQGRILKAVEESEKQLIAANAADVAAELQITTKDDED